MRLWHYKLIPFLPKSQLLAQWRELNCIFKNKPKHILINYVYEYPAKALYSYSLRVINQMHERGYRIKSLDNFKRYYQDCADELSLNNPWLIRLDQENPFPKHHEVRYFEQCFFNLEEKYDRGQKDFTKEQYEALCAFYSEQMIKYMMFNY